MNFFSTHAAKNFIQLLLCMFFVTLDLMYGTLTTPAITMAARINFSDKVLIAVSAVFAAAADGTSWLSPLGVAVLTYSMHAHVENGVRLVETNLACVVGLLGCLQFRFRRLTFYPCAFLSFEKIYEIDMIC